MSASRTPPRWVLPRATLEELAAKYEELELLRRRRDQELPFPPREQLRRLSRSFPGCLRELDRLSATELGARVAAVRAVLALLPEQGAASEGGGLSTAVVLEEEAAWMSWISRYHELVRGELERRRERLQGKAGAPRVRPRTPLADTATTGSTTTPSRPSVRAMAALAEETGVDAAALAAFLFPPRRRE